MELPPVTVLAFRLVVLSVVYLAISSRATAADSWLAEVRETAGTQRFGYPVSGEFQASAESDAALELQSAGKPVDAQFARLSDASASQPTRWSIDFASEATMTPLQSSVDSGE